jgi:Kef-type K+ transport system membrane component KefB
LRAALPSHILRIVMAAAIPTGPEQLLLALFVIFVSAKAIGELFERMNLPSVLGEIMAGALLGPYALGWIPISDTIHSVADLGVIFVLFSAGLETRPSDLIRIGGKSIRVAVAGVVVPFVLGFVYMKLRGNVSSEAVFVGAAMVATSVGITARIFADMRLLSTETAKIILGAAVFDDILGMIMLALVGGMASGGVNWLHMGVLVGEAVGFALFMLFVAPRIVSRIEPGVAQLSMQNASLVVALAICLLLSWLALKIGMAAIIGAFFAGLVFADYSPQWNLLPRVGGITEFLAPFFFFAIGARLNVSLIRGEILAAAAIVSVLAIVSKVIGCGLPLVNQGWRTVLQVGVGMMPRGEVALIVALVGLQSHIVSQSTYAIVVVMTAITTILAPPALRYLFRDEIRQTREASLPAPVQL